MPRIIYPLILLVVFLALVVSLPLMDDAAAEIGPMVTKPSEPGPYGQGWVDGTIRTSTKAYDTTVRYYYPASSSGPGAAPDLSDAPYPCIIWLPGFGGPYNSYVYEANHLTSYGMVVMSVGVNWDDFPNSADRADMEDFLDRARPCSAWSTRRPSVCLATPRVGASAFGTVEGSTASRRSSPSPRLSAQAQLTPLPSRGTSP